MVPQLLGRSFPKARNFTASSHQHAGFSIWVFNNFPEVGDTPGPSQRKGRPLPHPTPSPAFGASAPALGPKPWSPLTFQPWLRPWTRRICFAALSPYTDCDWSHLMFIVVWRSCHLKQFACRDSGVQQRIYGTPSTSNVTPALFAEQFDRIAHT